MQIFFLYFKLSCLKIIVNYLTSPGIQMYMSIALIYMLHLKISTQRDHLDIIVDSPM